MTIEEKAKAYDEAFKKAKQFHDKDLFAECNGNLVEYIFPELKESEDERVRKALIRYHQSTLNIDGIKGEDILVWLEKQASKPKWTEEDSSMQLTLIRDIELVSFISKEGKDERIMWLNKLDDRFHQNTNDILKSKWSDEDEELLQHCCGAVAAADYYTLEDKEEMENWLKSLKQRI